MSIEAMARVWKHSSAEGSALLVLLALADYADDHDRAWPSQATLAAKARMSDRNVRRVLDRLVEMGELVIENAGGSGRGHSATYRITVERRTACPPSADGKVDTQDGKVDTQGQKGGHPCPRNHHRTIKDPPTLSARETEASPDEGTAVRTVLDADPWNPEARVDAVLHLLGSHRDATSSANLAVIRSALMDAPEGVARLVPWAATRDHPAAALANALRRGRHAEPARADDRLAAAAAVEAALPPHRRYRKAAS